MLGVNYESSITYGEGLVDSGFTYFEYFMKDVFAVTLTLGSNTFTAGSTSTSSGVYSFYWVNSKTANFLTIYFPVGYAQVNNTFANKFTNWTSGAKPSNTTSTTTVDNLILNVYSYVSV